MLRYSHLGDKQEIMKGWYDSYRFKDEDIYNPRSVLKYINKATIGKYEPEYLLANTSRNDIIDDYIEKSDASLHDDFEKLMNNKTITKKIIPELTYREMDNRDNIYNFLLFVGYLKIAKIIDESYHIYELEIPNSQVKVIYQTIFDQWFNKYKNQRTSILIHYFREGCTSKAMDCPLRQQL